MPSSKDPNSQKFTKLKKVETDPDPDLYDITYVDVTPSESCSSPLSKSPWSVQVDPNLIEPPRSSASKSTASHAKEPKNYSPNILMGSLVREEGHIYSLATSGDLLFTGSDSKNIRVWKNHIEFSTFKSNSGLVKAIVLAADKIFTGHQDGKIRVWKVSSKDSSVFRRVGTMPLIRDYIKNSIASSSYLGFMRRNRTSTSAQGFRHLDAISCLALSEDRRLLYSGSWDKTFKVWRVSDLRCLESVNAHDDAVNAVVAGFDGLVFSGSADGSVKVWRREDQAKETRHFFSETLLKQDCAVTAIAVDQSGMLIYCGSSDGTVNFWERDTNMKNGGVLKGHKLAVLCLFAAGNLLFSGSADLGIRVWRRPERGGGGGGRGGEHACVSVLTGHAGPVKCLAVERDQESVSGERRWIVYSGSLDRSVKMWRVSENSPPLEFTTDSSGGSSRLTVAPSFSAQGRISHNK